ncbi:hypothetical protein [Candidatus Thiothrix anitrata]|uniref:Tetratricopeptide repeat protein n=1 Tax=Candidatus Thiothrix anitrata TaxID=2823902 RepID=A0ABX7X848_9GAMM|nr:hypothetical protein [Candidatus Thiothrix anitrata]QTR51164.1 hypothetical protein J8380_06325 [Candidatus Thiothrix anitrata]
MAIPITKDFIGKLLQMMKQEAPNTLRRVDRQKVLDSLARRGITLPQPVLCTDAPMHTEDLDKMPGKDRDAYETLYHAMCNQDAPRKIHTKALQTGYALREKYPHIPSIYNYIHGLNFLLGKSDEAFAVLQETVERFPNYLFGKIGLAEHYLKSAEYHKIPAVFAHKFELHQHFPEGTSEFHVSEALAFYSVIGVYHAYTGDIAQALVCYFMIANLNPEHRSTKHLAYHITLADMDKKIAHQDLLEDFLQPENTEEQWDEDTIDDPTEAMYLMEQMKAHLPIIVTPTKHLVHSEVGKDKKLKINDKLKVVAVDYAGDEGGILCTIPRMKEILAVSLSHVMLDKKHPLYKYARNYQLRRIKTLASQQQYRAPF